MNAKNLEIGDMKKHREMLTNIAKDYSDTVKNFDIKRVVGEDDSLKHASLYITTMVMLVQIRYLLKSLRAERTDKRDGVFEKSLAFTPLDNIIKQKKIKNPRELLLNIKNKLTEFISIAEGAELLDGSEVQDLKDVLENI